MTEKQTPKFIDDGALSIHPTYSFEREDPSEIGPDDGDATFDIKFAYQGEADEVLVGKIAAHVIDRTLGHKYGWSDFEIFDASAKSMEIFEEVYQCQPTLPESLASCLDGGVQFDPNVLVVNSVDILPEFRGHNLGLRALRMLVDRGCGGVGLVILKPTPKQISPDALGLDEGEDEWNRSLQLDRFAVEAGQGETKLWRYFARLGFIQVPGSEFMLLDPNAPLPDARDLQCVTGTGMRRTERFESARARPQMSAPRRHH